MPNEEMEGRFLGGGYIAHIVSGGEIYIKAQDLAMVFQSSAYNLGEQALADGDKIMGGQAIALNILGAKVLELRSELLKRELEMSFALESKENEQD